MATEVRESFASELAQGWHEVAPATGCRGSLIVFALSNMAMGAFRSWGP